jgi:hypothetical protein
MKIEITKDQYEKLRGKDVCVAKETVYYIITGAGAPRSVKRVMSPLTEVRVKAGATMNNLTAKQKVALAAAMRVTGTDAMARGELGGRLAKELKTTKDMGSKYVSVLIKEGALEVTG